jgi:predicted transcriptional regulator
MKRVQSSDELEAELKNNPEYRRAERRLKPYYDLALQIIKLRAMLGFTQKDLAEKAGTYQSRISKIESSEFDIRLSTLTSIAEALDRQVSINLIPSNEVFYTEKEKVYRDLFRTNVASEGSYSSVPLDGPENIINLPTTGAS